MAARRRPRTMSSTRAAWKPFGGEHGRAGVEQPLRVRWPRARSGRSSALADGRGSGVSSSATTANRRADGPSDLTSRVSTCLRRGSDLCRRPAQAPLPAPDAADAAAAQRDLTRDRRAAGDPLRGDDVDPRRVRGGVAPLGQPVPCPSPHDVGSPAAPTSACCSTTRPTTCSRSGGRRSPGPRWSGSTRPGSGDHLLRDITHTDVDLVVTEPAHLDDLAGLDLGDRPVLVSRRFAETAATGAAGAGTPTSPRPWRRSAATTAASSTTPSPAGRWCSRPGPRARPRRSSAPSDVCW